MRGPDPAGGAGGPVHLLFSRVPDMMRVAALVFPWTLLLVSAPRAMAQPARWTARAPPATTQRRSFETASQQINYLAAAPLGDQISSLTETIGEISDDPDIYRRVVNAWLAGDVAALEKDALQPLAKASPRMYRRLISDRNRRWAEVLATRLKGEGVIVVVVGTAHLLGPEGVPALLRDRGFDVEGPG